MHAGACAHTYRGGDGWGGFGEGGFGEGGEGDGKGGGGGGGGGGAGGGGGGGGGIRNVSFSSRRPAEDACVLSVALSKTNTKVRLVNAMFLGMGASVEVCLTCRSKSQEERSDGCVRFVSGGALIRRTD